MNDDRRLIEDYLPIGEISVESSREKRQLSGLHLWWARRPLVACRAAIYGCLMPSTFFEDHSEPPASELDSRRPAAQFISSLCSNGAEEPILAEARRHIATACGTLGPRGERPRVLDMFAGGGAIPLEALRLGCDSYALDLNPVAHIIQLCTLVYPQKYFAEDLTTYGSTPGGQWAGLTGEIRFWAERVISRVTDSLAEFHPMVVPDKDCPQLGKVAPKVKTIFGAE